MPDHLLPQAAPQSRRLALRFQAESLPLPQDVPQVYYSDTECPGLRLRVARSGKRVWDWRRGTTTTVIGPLPTVSYDAAAQQAGAWNEAASTGADPRAVVLAVNANSITVADLYERYIAHLVDSTRSRKANESATNCRSQIKPLLARYGDLPAIDLSRNIIRDVYMKDHLAPTRPEARRVISARAMIQWTKSGWSWAVLEGLAPRLDRVGLPKSNPAERLILHDRKLLRRGYGRHRSHTTELADDELLALMRGIEQARYSWVPGKKRRAGDAHAATNPAGLLIVEFCLYTGCRKSEAVYLMQGDIATDGSHATINEHKTMDHDGEARTIRLGPEARRVLELAAEWRQRIRYEGALMFPSPLGGVCTTVNKALDAAILAGGLKRRIVVHSLRGGYINYACRSGVPLEVVSENVGHGDIRTTQTYYRKVHDRMLAAGNDQVSAEFTRLREGLMSEAH
jgi:integrase